jgi:poly-gamma-glutamate synthesis protein (capsule biosynthesis protein)
VHKRFAHELVDAGVDIIIGQHPHVVQGIELYEGKPVFYSFGNFIFDQYFSQETQESFMALLRFDDGALGVRVLPLASVRSQQGPMPEPRATEWTNWFWELGDSLPRSAADPEWREIPLRP